MTNTKTIIASLEGAQIIVDEKLCQLQEYNFVENHWYFKEECPRPLSRARAERWLYDWNHVDRFAAMTLLTTPAATDWACEEESGSDSLRKKGSPKS